MTDFCQSNSNMTGAGIEPVTSSTEVRWRHHYAAAPSIYGLICSRKYKKVPSFDFLQSLSLYLEKQNTFTSLLPNDVKMFYCLYLALMLYKLSCLLGVQYKKRPLQCLVTYELLTLYDSVNLFFRYANSVDTDSD